MLLSGAGSSLGNVYCPRCCTQGRPTPSALTPRAHPSKQRRWVGGRDVQCTGLPSPHLPGVQDAEPSQSCQGWDRGVWPGRREGKTMLCGAQALYPGRREGKWAMQL